ILGRWWRYKWITFHPSLTMFLSPLPVVLEWHCVMCGQHFPGKKFCEACGTGIYSRAVCTKYVYSYQPDLFLDCGSAST
ncbi:putative zinc ribbon protein, partial [Escherichia sp. MOD1-EC5457]|uniref:putative zinc ribbon protein n=1 Tax=Escherichia sp. MOD1-EC5457 TaxID=2093874 RepID=UPI00262B7C69